MAQGPWYLKFIRIKTKKHKKITQEDIISFFQQLSTLLLSGSPLLHGIRLCATQSASQKLTEILNTMSSRISSGGSFYSVAQEHPEVFKSHWCEVIHTGELTGQLGSLLQQLTAYIQQGKKTQEKITGAMIYPVILMCVAVGAIVIMLWKVVPTFAEFFKDFGGKLPPITQFVINLSDFVQHRGPYILVGVGLFYYAFRAWVKTPRGKRTFDSILVTIPLLGDLIVESSMEKYATNFALLLRAGTPLLESIRTVQEVFRENAIYYDAMERVYGNVSRGSSLSASLVETGLFTDMVLSMTKMGEESGKLADVLEQVAKYYREKLETTISQLTSMLEPLIVIFMGVVVAGMLMSIYIPMFQMAAGGGK
jgi:type IV pilus assembly protein PilC